MTDMKEHLVIHTLGQFQVRRGNEQISSENKRSYRIWELGKYFITNRHKPLYSETILEDLWPNRDYSDARRALRTQIYRLRRLLDREACSDENSCIQFAGGAYCWNRDIDYWLDVQSFESLYNKAIYLRKHDPVAAIEKYQQAARLYKGDYLPEISHAEWVIPIRNYYNHMYIQLVFDLTDLLHKMEKHHEIIDVLENAFLIEFFEEEFHFRYLRALIAVGRVRQAQAHYEYTASILYKEMGMEMSDSLRDLYRKILFQNNSVTHDLQLLQETMHETEASGAFLCTTDVFRHLYNLELRRNERGNSIFLAMFTISLPGFDSKSPLSLKSEMDCLQETLLTSLRRGDAISRWNESQFLVLITEITQENADMVLRRIKFNFTRFSSNHHVQIEATVKPVKPNNIQ